MKTAHLNVLTLTVLVVTISNFCYSKRTIQSSAFEDVHEGKRLSRNPLETIKVKIASKCAVTCNKNSSCRSFNFCGDKTCEFNTEDLYSTVDGDSILKEDSNCVYFGMKQTSIPLCHEDDQYVDVQSDTHKRQCDIHEKRVDMLGKSKESVVVDTEDEYKSITETEIEVDVAHGGLRKNDEVTMWLRFVRTTLNWTDAKENCKDLGGKLFHDVKGTEAQLSFLSKRMNREVHWVGIRTLCCLEVS